MKVGLMAGSDPLEIMMLFYPLLLECFPERKKKKKNMFLFFEEEKKEVLLRSYGSELTWLWSEK